MTQTRTCFVIMPIRKAGSPEHAHFRAIFSHLKPIVERANFHCVRADELNKTGAITKDIVLLLAQADLVVADLTDLNPNVFYELGVRHALRGKGTVMIIDEKRTADIPFDLSAYRVIKFSGELTGMENLDNLLEKFLAEIEEHDDNWKDNPIHDWFPTLPSNLVAATSGSIEGSLRQKIRELQSQIARYEKALPNTVSHSSNESSPLSTVLAVIADAEDGLLPFNVMEETRKSFESKNVVAFLQKIRVILERGVRLSSGDFLTLTRQSRLLDLLPVQRALFEQALQIYPADENLRKSYWANLAHSQSSSDRALARNEMSQALSLRVAENVVYIDDPERFGREMELVGMLLDAYHGDKLDQQALQITLKMLEVYPERTRALRAHARALGQVGQIAKSMEFHRASVLAPDVDDTSAIWLGNELHNQQQHLEASEAYAMACVLDPAEAAAFAHLFDELCSCVIEQNAGVASENARSLPEGLSQETIAVLAHCAVSCPNADGAVSERVRRAFERMEMGIPQWTSAISRDERRQTARGIYGKLKSRLTTRE